VTTAPELLYTMLIPALGGLAVGFPSGLLAGILATLRWAARRRDRGQAMPIYTDDDNPTPGQVPLRGREHLSKLGWLLVALGILGFLAGTISVFQSNSTSSCLRTYIEQSSAVSRERADAGQLDREAIRQQRSVTREFYRVIVDGVAHAPTDPAEQERRRAEFVQKLEGWDARLAEVDRLDAAAEQKRQENPLPARPAC
jgi:hypothetical protein